MNARASMSASQDRNEKAGFVGAVNTLISWVLLCALRMPYFCTVPYSKNTNKSLVVRRTDTRITDKN
jgi:hypothetical protein